MEAIRCDPYSSSLVREEHYKDICRRSMKTALDAIGFHDLKDAVLSGEAFLDCEPEEQTALLREAGEVLSKQYPIDTNLLETFKLVVKNLSLPQRTQDELLQAFISK